MDQQQDWTESTEGDPEESARNETSSEANEGGDTASAEASEGENPSEGSGSTPEEEASTPDESAYDAEDGGGDDSESAESSSSDASPSESSRADTRRRRASSAQLKLERSLTDLKNEVQDRVRGLLRSKKALEQICRKGALDNLELVRKYTGWIREADLEPIELEERRQKAVDALDTYVERRRRKRRQRFMREFHRRADAAGVDVEKLSESPLAMHVDPVTVEVDFEADRATLSHARIELDEVDLDAEAILESRADHLDRLRERTLESPAFFDRLREAYRTTVRRRGGSEVERVDLVDLLAPLALLSSDVESWRTSDPSDLDPYPRHLLAYQIQRLRRDGCLERDGWRIDLGTATGGSTDDKDDVLFIPSGRDEGQYYLSIRFTQQEKI